MLSRRSSWPAGSRDLAEQLHQLLTLRDRDWHALKGQPQRRGAEQLSAALAQLLAEDNPPQGRSTAAQERSIELAEHALGWLKGERKDPGCPSHGH